MPNVIKFLFCSEVKRHHCATVATMHCAWCSELQSAVLLPAAVSGGVIKFVG
jgi:hypothetical protein